MAPMSGADKLQAAFNDIQSQRSMAGSYAMNAALGFLQKEDYASAVVQLKRALSFVPDSVDAYNFLASSYTKLGKQEDAINAYKNIIRIRPNNAEFRNNLANAYMDAKKFDEAEKEYKNAARIDPTSTVAPYTLGHLYLNTGRTDEAVQQFQKVVNLDRSDAHGYYGLGLAYNKLGRYDEAAAQLKQAVQIDPEFALAQKELGQAYAGGGNRDQLELQQDLLSALDPELAGQLRMATSSPRMIVNIYTENSLNTIRGSGTSLADLDSALAAPNASKDFEMVFQFDSEMDLESVQNPYNWSIGQANGGLGGIYNNGISLNPDAEVLPTPVPKTVTYDSTKLQATIRFSITQNENGDGIIDPSHLVFKFSGTDIYGNKMDPEADQFDGAAIFPY